ncbi:entericidin A/B family lipoprotein [Defluviimonas sp. WL0002]|uniref:Entericidin A/B family lipoprotein n=1 Tax=Albidovulum marisflavi TaxID=2984159 RepID=A0ABT2ZGJ0_9RHOB|nr:entericidin A/B family lipoprotein [Defluviimonas sp. WL0002]MCV2870254.1 entericidin A/B family lipoprotein [Defluviimonas sp. WL0002]
MTRNAFVVLGTLGFLFLSACETIEGAGRDIQTAGEAVTDSAQDAHY